MSSQCNYKDSHKDCLPAVCLAVRRDGTHAKTSYTSMLSKCQHSVARRYMSSRWQ